MQQKLAALEPNLICFGHGQPLQENAAKMLHTFAQQVKADSL